MSVHEKNAFSPLYTTKEVRAATFLITSKVSDARRRIVDPAVLCVRSDDKSYEQYVARRSHRRQAAL
ncbi:MAG: hypothetical protein WAL98_19570 [Desulfatiglandaceae bacterium]